MFRTSARIIPGTLFNVPGLIPLKSQASFSVDLRFCGERSPLPGPLVSVRLLAPFLLSVFLNHRRQLRVQQRRLRAVPNIENRIAPAAEKSCRSVNAALAKIPERHSQQRVFFPMDLRRKPMTKTKTLSAFAIFRPPSPARSWLRILACSARRVAGEWNDRRCGITAEAVFKVRVSGGLARDRFTDGASAGTGRGSAAWRHRSAPRAANGQPPWKRRSGRNLKFSILAPRVFEMATGLVACLIASRQRRLRRMGFKNAVQCGRAG